MANVVVSETNSSQSSVSVEPEEISKTSSDTQQHQNSHMLDVMLIIIGSVLIVLLFWYQRRTTLTYITIVVAAILINAELESVLEKEYRLQQKLQTYQDASAFAGKIESTLSNNLALLSGFAAYISAEPELDKISFNNYAKQIFKEKSLLINFAAARDLVVNLVYPLTPSNRKVIGLDYKTHPQQSAAVLQLVNRRKLMVVGPVNLVQGGTAFIGRVPIFRSDNGKLWGIISAPVDAEGLYQAANVDAVTENYHVAIRNFDADGVASDAFFGSFETFFADDATIIKIPAGGSYWEVALLPRTTPHVLETNIIVIRTVTAFSIFIIGAFAFFRFRQEKERALLVRTIKSNQELLENVGQVANIGGWKMDVNELIIEWTEQASIAIHREKNFSPESLQDLRHVFTEDDFLGLSRCIETAFLSKKSFDIELQLYDESGEECWARVIGDVTENEDDVLISGTVQDVTESVASSKLIEYQATYDALTQLPNRVVFNDRLHKAIDEAKRRKTRLGVLFIDLDRFKPVNDTHGHAIGDQLLQESALRIKACVRESDTVSRLSGDEFGAVIHDVGSTTNMLRIIESIISTMQEPFIIEGNTLHCSVSIGIAVYPDDDDDAQQLIRKADQAMYEVKSNGRNGWQFYTKEMQAKSEKRHAILHDLIVAIEKQELIPYLQPIVDLKTKKIVKCEALARWPLKSGDFVSPIEFISLAEETGLVNKIDLSMMKQAGTSIISADEDARVALSINVSPRLFSAKDHSLENWLSQVEDLSSVLEITVEITERLLTDDSEKSLEILSSLKRIGVKIAIDDFGTGYSSLSYLVKFPVDIIKIDRSFVSKIEEENDTSNTLVETILVMAKRLGIQVVAEGIETKEQLNFLQKHGCDFGQGYLLGKPMTMAEFQLVVERQKPKD